MTSSEGSRPPDRLLTKQELAEYLRRTPRTIDNYVRDGMPYIQCGGGKLFDLQAVLRWMSGRRRGDDTDAATS